MLDQVTNQAERNTLSLLGIITWSVGASFFLYEFFLRTFLGALAEQIIPAIHLSPSQFALLASVFYLAYGVMQVPAGAITDKLGAKLTLVLASLLCALAAFIFSQAHSFYVALICRFLMGLGGGFAFICLLIITIEWFPKKYLALFIGLGQFIGTMGALIASGPLAGIVVKHHVPWRAVFTVIAIVGIFIGLAALIFVKKKARPRENRLIVIKREEHVFTKIKKLFKSKQAWWVATYSAFVFLTVAMLGAVWGTIYLQSLGFSQQTAASIISFAWLGFACGCPLLGYLSDIFIRRKPVMLFCSVFGLLLVIVFVYLPLHSSWVYALILFFLGITSSGQSIGFTIITEHVVPELRSLALGLNSAFITLLAAIVPYFVGLIIQSTATHAKEKVIHYQHSDFYLAFSLLPILYTLSTIIIIFFIKETFCRSQKQVIMVNQID